ncbi:MAG: aldehyde dehydrogenase family protein [Boseongicola sp. SB0673_bin_14]|nr:aldehyde dehydrogenase family protein [Boseongicola sp. SB0667_bin_21]MYI68804.1 aldehyde dehydrogenase family protein [Boseongicola sp. SB0673_bin_14]
MSKELKNYVAGLWIGSGTTFDKVSPFDGAHVAKVHEASATLVDEAVTRGHEVSIGSNASIWGDLPMKQRLAVIHDLADRLEARVEDLVEAEVADTGRSHWQASVFDGARAARLFRSYAVAAASLENRSMQFSGELGFQGMWHSTRRPKGVIACICPWNVPILMAWGAISLWRMTIFPAT